MAQHSSRCWMCCLERLFGARLGLGPRETETPCLTQPGSLEALAIDVRTWPGITLDHLHA